MATPTIAPSVLRKVVVERFRQGRRTVSVFDLADHFGRTHDLDFTNRVRVMLPDTAELVSHEYPCLLVNDYCVRFFADAPVTDEAEARRCNVFNSGGKAPVGIRRAAPDDLVRAEENSSLARLGIGVIKAAVRNNANDVHAGVSAAHTNGRLRKHLDNELPKALDATPEPIQEALLPSDDEGR